MAGRSGCHVWFHPLSLLLGTLGQRGLQSVRNKRLASEEQTRKPLGWSINKNYITPSSHMISPHFIQFLHIPSHTAAQVGRCLPRSNVTDSLNKYLISISCVQSTGTPQKLMELVSYMSMSYFGTFKILLQGTETSIGSKCRVNLPVRAARSIEFFPRLHHALLLIPM